MLRITRIDSFRDGGTIAIFATVSLPEFGIEADSRLSGTPFITIDYSIGTDTRGQWYFGMKKYGGKPMDNEKLKERVIEEIEDHIKLYQHYLNSIKQTWQKN